MDVKFDQTPATWPYKETSAIDLATSFRSAMSRATSRFVGEEADAEGALGLEIMNNPLYSNAVLQGGLRSALARLMQVNPENISLHGNTHGAVDVIARRYPFNKGDVVLAYRGDYPSVYEPFTYRKDLEVRFIEGFKNDCGVPERVDFEELDSAIQKSKAKLITISHVLYRSGQKLDLVRLKEICASHGANLIVDVAQSIGVNPICPGDLDLDAVVFPLWKGLSAPRGVAALWTSPELTRTLLDADDRAEDIKELIRSTKMTALGCGDAREFEPSTLPTTLIAGAKVAVEQDILAYPSAAIEAAVQRLQNLFAEKLDRSLATPVLEANQRGGTILAIVLKQHVGQEDTIVAEARKAGIRITNRDGMIRIAPHYHATDEEIVRAAETINKILSATRSY